MNPNNLIQFVQHFKDEKTALKAFEQIRWVDGKPICPHCEYDHAYRYSNGKHFKCASCRKKFTVLMGTAFESTKIPLQKWFLALYMATSRKKGISSLQLAKDISVSTKTAWYMLQRVRTMVQVFQPEALEGIVEIDESYFGGKNKNKHFDKKIKNSQGRNMEGKIAVFGMKQREGFVKTMPVPNVKMETLTPIVYDHVEPSLVGNKIYSDDWTAYYRISQHYEHAFVSHGKGQYGDGEVNTNHMENTWSHYKRSYHGCYHSVSKKYMIRYCAEWDYRMNTRHSTDYERFNLALQGAKDNNMTYKQLTNL